MHTDSSFLPRACGLRDTRPWDPALSSSLLSVLGEGFQRETEIWGHQHHLGLVEGLVGSLEGTQVLETIGSYMGARLHVKGGRQYSIYFNKHL